jgi:hypothetical protein
VTGKPPTVTAGVVTVAAGVVTVAMGVVTVGVGGLIAAVGVFGRRRLCHFAFHAASACPSRPLNPLGVAILLDPLVPFNPLEAAEDSAVALYSLASATA